MKRLLTLLALGLFIGGGIVGCEANAKVGDPDSTSSNGTSYSKKTTTVREPDGDRTTKTEVKTSNY